MTSDDPYSDFVERAYDAVLEPRLWNDVLERFADLLGGSEANLVDQDEVRCEGTGIYVRSDPAALPLYLGHFMKCSPFLNTSDLPPTLRVLTDQDRLPKNELIRTEFYNDFFRRFQVHSILWVRLALTPGRSTVLTVVRPASREPFGRADVQTAERLHSHLIRAWRLFAGMSRERLWLDGAGMLVDDGRLAVFLVGGGNVVRRTNRAGEALLEQNDALFVRNGVLRGSSSEATRKLHGLIASARQNDSGPQMAGVMSVARDGRAPLAISVLPVRRQDEACSFADGLDRPVLVCASEPEQCGQIPEERLRGVFGLTRMEARVAALLLSGREPREAARRLGISFYTVRGHLGRIFDKTGVHRQAELVQLLTRATDQLPR